MDRKAIIVLIASFSLLMLWPVFVNKLYPPQPAPIRTNVITQATNAVTPGVPGTNASLTATNPLVVPAAAAPQLVTTNAPEQVEVIENANARYTFTTHGGGIKYVELKGYPEAISCKKEAGQSNRLASLNYHASVPVLALLDGGLQGDGIFQLTRGADSMRAEKALPNGLFLVHEFRLQSNYLVNATARIENRGPQAVALPPHTRAVGTATPIEPMDDGTHLGVFWSDGASSSSVKPSHFSPGFWGCVFSRPAPTIYQAGQSNVAWAAVHNQFFALAVVTHSNAALQATMVPTNLPALTPDELKRFPKAKPHPVGYQATLHFAGAVIAPGQSLHQQFAIYAGPREFHTLARNGAVLQNDLDAIMDFGMLGFLSKILLLSMNGIRDLFSLPYGGVIIVITVIIKLLFWPLTQASTRSMKRMQTLQPQMKALQEKYKGDPAKMNRKLMEFMKENKVSPMAGCLPMLIQLPVFIAFYQMIQTAIELRGAQFLWACDLTKPDTVFVIPGFGWNVNPMPLLMGLTMLWQARLTPPSPGMDPMQQKIMKYMPLMFLFILYNFSAGLTLYWTVQNLLTIAQMKLTRAKDPAPATPAAPARPAPQPPSRKKK